MPQMAPISWLSLFMVFSLTLILFNMLNYFSFLPKSSQSSTLQHFSHKSFSWKW